MPSEDPSQEARPESGHSPGGTPGEADRKDRDSLTPRATLALVFEFARLWKSILETIAAEHVYYADENLNWLYLHVVQTIKESCETLHHRGIELDFNPIYDDVLQFQSEHGSKDISVWWDFAIHDDVNDFIARAQKTMLSVIPAKEELDHAAKIVQEDRERVHSACRAYAGRCETAFAKMLAAAKKQTAQWGLADIPSTQKTGDGERGQSASAKRITGGAKSRADVQQESPAEDSDSETPSLSGMLHDASSTLIGAVLFELAKLWEQMLETVATTPSSHKDYYLNAVYLDVVDSMKSCRDILESPPLNDAFMEYHPLCDNLLAPTVCHGVFRNALPEVWERYAKGDAATLLSRIQRFTKNTPDRLVDRAQAMVAELRARVMAACQNYKEECQVVAGGIAPTGETQAKSGTVAAQETTKGAGGKGARFKVRVHDGLSRWKAAPDPETTRCLLQQYAVFLELVCTTAAVPEDCRDRLGQYHLEFCQLLQASAPRVQDAKWLEGLGRLPDKGALLGEDASRRFERWHQEWEPALRGLRETLDERCPSWIYDKAVNPVVKLVGRKAIEAAQAAQRRSSNADVEFEDAPSSSPAVAAVGKEPVRGKRTYRLEARAFKKLALEFGEVSKRLDGLYPSVVESLSKVVEDPPKHFECAANAWAALEMLQRVMAEQGFESSQIDVLKPVTSAVEDMLDLCDWAAWLWIQCADCEQWPEVTEKLPSAESVTYTSNVVGVWLIGLVALQDLPASLVAIPEGIWPFVNASRAILRYRAELGPGFHPAKVSLETQKRLEKECRAHPSPLHPFRLLGTAHLLSKYSGNACEYLAGLLDSVGQPDGAVLTKAASVESVSTGDDLPPLNDTEQNIIEALGCSKMTGQKLAKRAGYRLNANFKATLSSMRKRGLLDNKSPGYVVSPQYYCLIPKSDKGQDQGQD